MKVVALRFVPFEDLGIWEAALRKGGATIEYIDPVFDSAWADQVHDASLVVVLGGPIAVYDDTKYPIIRRALSIVENRLRMGSPLLGVCLGAQLIAKVMGARVYRSGSREIGWAGVSLTEEGRQSPLKSLSTGIKVLHWHGDTFNLPGGASRLAFTQKTENQAFSFGNNVLALQFHAEARPLFFEQWLIGHAAEMHQTTALDIAEVRAGCPKELDDQIQAGQRVLLDWIDGWNSRAKPVASAMV
ncbi:glutamine amidotransferase [Bradyrhizobium japonicum]|uniref:glutamine amidotransferase n=1 Tax=Bradyrhizobium japonicum TaxID=375 RepID=UPI000676969F|nr:glutamine amidotransferase [Bradyrhizobium japonicum]